MSAPKVSLYVHGNGFLLSTEHKGKEISQYLSPERLVIELWKQLQEQDRVLRELRGRLEKIERAEAAPNNGKRK